MKNGQEDKGRKDKNQSLGGRVVALIIMIIICIGVCILAGVIIIHGQSQREIPKISYVSSAYSVRPGEEVRIYASLSYEDGRIEDGEFSFEITDGNDDNVLVLVNADEAGISTDGLFKAIEPDAWTQESYSVTVTISCTSVADVSSEQMTISIIQPDTSSIIFNYMSYNSDADEVVSCSETAVITDGQVLSDVIDFNADVMQPYSFSGWYVVENGVETVKFEESSVFYSDYWQGEIVLRAIYSAEITVSYDTSGVDNYSASVTYGSGEVEELIASLESSASELTTEGGERNGWQFAGWTTESGGEEKTITDTSLCSLFYGDGNIVLFTRWSTTISIDTLSDGTETDIQVIYGAPINYSHEYSNGGLLEGLYYYDESGSKVLISAATDDEGKNIVAFEYLLGANMSFAAVVSFAVEFYDMGEETLSASGLRVIYGEGLSDLPVLETEDGWQFICWQTLSGTNIDDTFIYEEQGTLVLYSIRQASLAFYLELDEDGKADEDSVAYVDVVYGAELIVPESPTAGDWEFDGWFTGKGGSGGEITNINSYTGSGTIAFYAAWKTTITFSYVLETVDSVAYSASSEVWYNGAVDYPEPEYTSGGEFAGWYYVGEDGVQYIVDTDAVYTLSASCEFTAEIKFTLSLNDFSDKYIGSTYIYYGKSVDGSGYVLEKLDTSDGWEFVAWCTTDGSSAEEFTEETVFGDTYISYVQNGVYNLYARRITTLYLYRELDEDGEIDSESLQILNVYYGLEFELPEGLTAGDWVFSSWFTGKGGSGEQLQKTYTGVGECSFYAKWSGTVNLELTFDSTKVSTTSVAVVFNAEITGLPANYTEGSHRLGGWYTEQYGNGMQIKNGDTYSVTTLTLYDAVEFTITFSYNNSAEYEISSMTVIYGHTVDFLPTPIMTGWIFYGWYTQSGRGGYLFSLDSPYMTEGSMVLYDSWYKTITYTDITGTLNNYIEDYTGNFVSGSESTVQQTIYYDEIGSTYSCLFDLSDEFGTWTFGGWYTEEFGEGVKYESFDSFIEADTRLYAYWYIENLPVYYQDADGNTATLDKIIYGMTICEATGFSLEEAISEVANNSPSGYGSANGWYNNSLYAFVISDDTVAYPADMEGLYLLWSANVYTVTVEYDGVSYTWQVRYDINGIVEGEPPVLERTGYILIGYSYNDNRYFHYDGDSVEMIKEWDIAGDVSLEIEWQIETYKLVFDSDGGSSVDSITVTYGDVYPTLTTPTRTGYTFDGWYINGTKISAGDTVTDLGDYSSGYNDGDVIETTVTAKWTAIQISFTLSDYSISVQEGSTETVTVTVSGGSGSYEIECSTATGITSSVSGNTITFTGTAEASGSITVKVTDSINETTASDTINYTVTKSDDDSDSECFTKGSLITLADGSTKPVEELQAGDMIMVFDHYTGTISGAPVAYIFYNELRNYEIINLYFSNGTEINVLFGHGFFDKECNEYVVISVDNVEQYIGHYFYSIDSSGDVVTSSWARLVSYSITYEYTECYSVVSAVHINHIVNGMLAVSDDIEGLYNIFELDSDMKYDVAKMQEDIEAYGLFTYEEWADYVTYEQFIAFNGAYIKVAIGKGLTTYEKIIALIETFLS